VQWPAGSKEQIVEITIGGTLPNEVGRYDLKLTWSIQGIVIATSDASSAGVTGVINNTRHTLFSVYEDPLNPAVSNKDGTKWYAETGLSRQRLDKLLQAIGGNHHRFPTPKPADIDRLIWLVHKHVNDSSPPYFNGERGAGIRYGKDGPLVEYIDQWVMWLASHTWNKPPKRQPHWNYGACISYVQLMKTMLAITGVNAQRAWVLPKTTVWPDGKAAHWTDADLVDVDNDDKKKMVPQGWTFVDTTTGIEYKAEVRLIDKPLPNGAPYMEAFEACLYYGGKLVPGAIPTHRYPSEVLHDRVGFANATEVLRWWHSVKHGDFERFMAWVAQTPAMAYFDKDGNYYDSPYKIPVDQRLPVP
jgi:hypothetical protein